MLYLYFGSDTYTIREEIRKLRSKFSLVEEVDPGEDINLKELLESQGLFSQNKLILLRNFLNTLDSGDWDLFSKSNHDLVFVQTESFDARRAFFKKLKKEAKVKEFELPREAALEAWIEKYLEKRGIKIEKPAIALLLARLGEEATLWQAANELEKLALYVIARNEMTKQSQGHEIAAPSARNDEITLADVREVVPRNLDQNVFALTNLFAEGKIAESGRVLEDLVGSGNPAEIKKQAIQVIGALASQIRSLAAVKEVQDLEAAEAANILGWKEGRVWVNKRLAKKFSPAKLRQMLMDLKQIDLRLKTSEEPPKLLLTLFLQKSQK